MWITMESTEHITDIDGVPVRLWEGETSVGTKCKIFVHRIAVANNKDTAQFEKELAEQLPPGQKIPLRNIL